MNTLFPQISEPVFQLAQKAEELCRVQFLKIDANEEYNSQKVLAAFIKNGVSESHFVGSTGYGYGDRGRETLDAVFADAVGAEDALVRHNFVSGTHALSTALFGVLRPGDTLLAIAGRPYDTLEEVIGLTGAKGTGSLIDFGVNYDQVDLTENAGFDYDKIKEKAPDGKVIYLQRSRGYSLRKSLYLSDLEQAIHFVKEINPQAIIMVDNCYGEFVETKEPIQIGADLIIGSLIKNPGGGIARTGGYIAGRRDLVELCANRLTAPGVGKEVGCTLGEMRELFLGLFFSPHVTAQALKTAVFAAAFYELAGFNVAPRYCDYRTDIIQSLCLETPERLIAFCQGIQKGSPVDSFVAPEPWDMPGYDSQVIMAAGAFTGGASIELSADAPLREPYAVWMQGGLTYSTAKIGVLFAAQSMLEKGMLSIS